MYLNKEAGAMVAIAADDRFVAMIEILKGNLLAGLRAGRTEKQRKLAIPHFPFIVVYIVDKTQVHILRIFHAAHKLAQRFKSTN